MQINATPPRIESQQGNFFDAKPSDYVGFLLEQGRQVSATRDAQAQRDLQHRELMLKAMQLEQEANDSAFGRLIQMADIGARSMDNMLARRVQGEQNAIEMFKAGVQADSSKAELFYKIQELEYLRKKREDEISGRAASLGLMQPPNSVSQQSSWTGFNSSPLWGGSASTRPSTPSSSLFPTQSYQAPSMSNWNEPVKFSL